MMRKFAVLAVEGTHASGKTTLTHGLAAHYREQGIHVATVEEPARRSPFEEIVVHGRGQFDLETEADLFGAQLSAQLRAAHQRRGDTDARRRVAAFSLTVFGVRAGRGLTSSRRTNESEMGSHSPGEPTPSASRPCG